MTREGKGPGMSQMPLSNVPMFSALDIEELTAVATRSGRKKLQTDEQLFAQGDSGREFYVILSGAVRLTVDGKTLTDLKPGDYFGEMALLEDIPRQATATALEATDLLSLNRATLLELLTDKPELALGLLRGMARRLREFGEKATR